ncbi:hypothetical protein BDK88_4205 [Natrinema hispanicum]|uniref:Uncharacterized protein n=1 Tax=Natrinema hispanicum TaxID=392421 RepID=A0A482Y307_9EURY|nr:hypothetical protein BDK88_4205 [Natrinema hispanicum]
MSPTEYIPSRRATDVDRINSVLSAVGAYWKSRSELAFIEMACALRNSVCCFSKPITIDVSEFTDNDLLSVLSTKARTNCDLTLLNDPPHKQRTSTHVDQPISSVGTYWRNHPQLPSETLFAACTMPIVPQTSLKLSI